MLTCIMTSSIHEPTASNCDVTMTDCSRVVAMDAFLPPVFQHGASLSIYSIYIIITKNICYLLWNRGAWYLTIKVRGIRCTNHLHDSYPLTDVNPHSTAPGCLYHLKINSWWPIVTSSTHGPAANCCDVTMDHCSHGYLWTHEVGAS